MKNLFYILAIAALSITAPAFATAHTPKAAIAQEKEYKKIDVSAIDKTAMAAIKKGYGNYTVKEAWQASDGEYKLVLTKDGIDTTATFTKEGEMIRIVK